MDAFITDVEGISNEEILSTIFLESNWFFLFLLSNKDIRVDFHPYHPYAYI